jgi:hypothetical protein
MIISDITVGMVEELVVGGAVFDSFSESNSRDGSMHASTTFNVSPVSASKLQACLEEAAAGGDAAAMPSPGLLSTSHHITSHHITSHITSHHITSHHITSHHITSHHITSHHITSHHIVHEGCDLWGLNIVH